MPVTSQIEAELIRRILAGEREQFHALIRPYERSVYLAVLGLVKNDSEAEDIAQEAFVKAYRALASFRAEAKFSTWLLSIALNEARSRLRRPDRSLTDSLDEKIESYEGDFAPAILTDWREIPSEALERKELRSILENAVKELPDLYRQVFTLRDLEELEPEEVASLLGITTNLVKVRLHRARMMLQKRLAPVLKSFAPRRRSLFGRKSWI